MTYLQANCPSCGRTFRESASRLCEGQVLSCPHCDQRYPLSRNSPFDEILRLMREARQSQFDRLTAQPYRWSA